MKSKDKEIQRRLAGQLYLNQVNMFETANEPDFTRNDDEILQ